MKDKSKSQQRAITINEREGRKMSIIFVNGFLFLRASVNENPLKGGGKQHNALHNFKVLYFITSYFPLNLVKTSFQLENKNRRKLRENNQTSVKIVCVRVIV